MIEATLAGPGRALPKNHMHVRLNPMRLNLNKLDKAPSRPNNYDQLLSAAIDEASGRAFVTEYAGKLKTTDLFSKAELNADALGKIDSAWTLAQFLVAHKTAVWQHPDMAEEIGTGAKLSNALATYMPNSGASAVAILLACGEYWAKFSWNPSAAKEKCIPPNAPSGITPTQMKSAKIDGKALQTHVQTAIIDPVYDTADLLAAMAKTTRLVMRISAAEMDRDPLFAFSTTLPDVAAAVTFQTAQVCPGGWLPATQTRLTVPGVGSYVLAQSASNWNNVLDARFTTAPAAIAIEVLDETGGPVGVATKQVELVDTAIKGSVPGKPTVPKTVKLDKADAWQPPVSDAVLTVAGPWPQPPGCLAKTGWENGKVPPAGELPDPQVDDTATHVPPDAGSETTSSSGSGSSGGADGGVLVDAGGAEAGGSSSGGSAGGSSGGSGGGGDDGGCLAGPRSGGMWPLLLLLICGLFVTRRRTNKL